MNTEVLGTHTHADAPHSALLPRAFITLYNHTYEIIISNYPCFGKHVKLLVSAAFAVVSTHSSFKEG
jgi:hypothetical protein